MLSIALNPPEPRPSSKAAGPDSRLNMGEKQGQTVTVATQEQMISFLFTELEATAAPADAARKARQEGLESEQRRLDKTKRPWRECCCEDDNTMRTHGPSSIARSTSDFKFAKDLEEFETQGM